MKAITAYYNQICIKKYQSLGFSRSKVTLARISGEVLQAFTFQRSWYAPTCYVDFGIFPLCMTRPIYIEAGAYRLDSFFVAPDGRSAEWTFDRKSDESMKDCIESIAQAIDRYLLPFFQACNDCKSTLLELMKLEELFDYNRKKRLLLIGSSDHATPWQERSLFDSRKYYMALKAEDFSYAREFLHHQVDHHKKTLKDIHEGNSPKQPESVPQRLIANLTLYAEHLERLESGDFGYFDELLQKNEEQMLTYLETNYPSVLRNS